MQDNIIPFKSKNALEATFEAENKVSNDNNPLPCDTEGQNFEYTGKRKTLATYSLMNDSKGWIVLCKREQASNIQPFVTWYYNAEDNAYYSGHYFANEIDARNDFKTRINQLTIH